VLHIRQAVTPPAEARNDWWIYVELARRLGHGAKFPYRGPREIFDELREASRGGLADYAASPTSASTASRACSGPAPARTTRAPRACSRRTHLPRRRQGHFQVAEYRESGDPIGAGFPLYLTTGRVVSQYLSGTQTRRIGPLVDQYPVPRLELHPRLAEQLASRRTTGSPSPPGARRSRCRPWS